MRSIDKGAISAPLFRQLLLILHDFLAFTATYPLAYPRSFPPPWSVEELDACQGDSSGVNGNVGLLGQ